jgi:dTDP-glucose 4,6-dehydratase
MLELVSLSKKLLNWSEILIMKTNSKEYDGKTALVTGAGGFIGSHLVQELLDRGAYVRAMYRYSSTDNLGFLATVSEAENLELFKGDINDKEICARALKDVDVVFHLAALIGIPYSYIAPTSYYLTNVGGTLNLINACRQRDVSPRFVQMSTSEVYGTAISTPMNEDHPLQAQSPYSASKIGADAFVTSYQRTFDLSAVIVRPFNNYGPRQSGRAVIPTIINQIRSKQREVRLGNLNSIRDFVYVKDTVRIISDLANCDDAVGKTINIGCGRKISIEQTAKLISELMGIEVSILSSRERIRPDESEVRELQCDNTKLNNLLGPTRFTEFKHGLSETIKWFDDKPLGIESFKYEV